MDVQAGNGANDASLQRLGSHVSLPLRYEALAVATRPFAFANVYAPSL